MVDAFQDELHVPELASAEFYDGAFLALDEPGALVVNFMNDDPKFDQTLQRLERAFGGAVVVMPALYDPNILGLRVQGACRQRLVGAAAQPRRAARGAPRSAVHALRAAPARDESLQRRPSL